MSALAGGLILLGVLAAALVLLAVRSGRAAPEADTRRAQNIAAFRERLAELDAAQRTAPLPDAEYRAARTAIERALLADADATERAVAAAGAPWLVTWGVALLVPLLAVGLYWQLGAADRVTLEARLERLGAVTTQEERVAGINEVLPTLERVVRRGDADGGYRFLLARLYMEMDRAADATAQFDLLIGQFPEDAGLFAQAARARFAAAGNRMTPAVHQLIQRGFALDPAQPVLLGMMGMDRFQAGDFRQAIGYWQRLLDQLPPAAPDRAIIAEGIALARRQLGPDAPPEPESKTATAAASVSLRVRVSLAPGLDARPGDTVFVFARAVQGPPMPLAVARLSVADLPREVELNDAMAMAPGLKLSGFPEVNVVARVSRSGNVMPAPGDMEAPPQRVAPATQREPLTLVIDHVLGAN